MHSSCKMIHPLLFLMYTFFISVVIGQNSTKLTDFEKIRNLIQHYYAAESFHSPEMAQKVYHDLATFTYVDNENIIINSYSVGEYLKGLAEKVNQFQHRKLSVDKIDICGNLASISSQIICVGRGKRINDYLSLVKEQNEWKIIHRLSFKEYASFDEPILSLNNAHEEAIKNVLLDYLKGRKIHDARVLKNLFHPHSDILHMNSTSENVNQLSLKHFIDYHSNQKDRRLKHRYKIVFAHCKGNIAIAKIQTRYKYFKTTITEYVSLALINDQWQIVKKLSHQDTSTKAIIL